ncbi:energy transducer TonB [Robiginitalea sediminis]|uniref:energy transducer TonB n=1 Tax=Robiginitalea sediminis TaxID=1982593 RepID=UPI000B4AC5B2|nr:energy transducer TonB [Robiginitalea sediminis]
MALLDTKHKKKSFTLTTLLLSALVLLLFYIGLTYMDPPEESGITVNLGTMEFGMGDTQPLEPVRRQQPEPAEEPEVSEPEPVTEPEVDPTPAATEAPTENVLTQDTEESVKINPEEEAQKRAEEAPRKAREEEARREQERQAEAERIRREQEAKKRELDAMMGGLNTSEGTAEGSEGDDNRPGDKGQPGGDPYATTYYGAPGTGSGTSGYGLSGRSLVSNGKVQQDCNQEGRVVVKITVDRNGRVVEATPGVRGTTNNHPCLLEPARKTAFLHKWNLDSNAPARQVGFVVVNFKLGQ